VTSPLGAAAAFASSGTWAFASARYSLATREVSAIRVNLARVTVTLPIWLAMGLFQGGLFVGLSVQALGWITLSTLCSYALADSLFFLAAKELGVASAMSIGSSYPLWSAMKGTLVDGEPFGTARALGTLLCVGGIAAIIKLGEKPGETGMGARGRGILLALATSVLWAGNTIGIKAAAASVSLPTINVVRHTLVIALLGALVLAGRVAGPSRPARGWLPLVPAILTDNLVGSLCFIYGLAHTDLAVGATLSSLAPLLTLPFAIAYGVEKITPAKLAAVTTTVAGILLLSR
jgi:drug/metabolite transporter (DMT)-like permease